MKRYQGLFRDTWWAWLAILGFGIVGASLLKSAIFYAAIPIGIFAFFYFGMMRYDDDGSPKEM